MNLKSINPAKLNSLVNDFPAFKLAWTSYKEKGEVDKYLTTEEVDEMDKLIKDVELLIIDK